MWVQTVWQCWCELWLNMDDSHTMTIIIGWLWCANLVDCLFDICIILSGIYSRASSPWSYRFVCKHILTQASMVVGDGMVICQHFNNVKRLTYILNDKCITNANWNRITFGIVIFSKTLNFVDIYLIINHNIQLFNIYLSYYQYVSNPYFTDITEDAYYINYKDGITFNTWHNVIIL